MGGGDNLWQRKKRATYRSKGEQPYDGRNIINPVKINVGFSSKSFMRPGQSGFHGRGR